MGDWRIGNGELRLETTEADELKGGQVSAHRHGRKFVHNIRCQG